jgi:hypothetical protein
MFTGINEFDEFLEDCLLDHSPLVQALGHLVEVDHRTNIFSKFLHLKK